MSKRLLKDIQVVKADADSWKFTCNPEENDITKLICTFPGVEGTPYDGGTFTVRMDVPNEYPLKQPKVQFETRVYHPNISSQTGAICIDILGTAWTPAFSIEKILISLQQLLGSPNPDDPQDAQVANVYRTNYDQFEQTAKEWTRKYARAPQAVVDPATIAKFTSMGFSEQRVLDVCSLLGLTQANSEEDQNRVLEQLLN